MGIEVGMLDRANLHVYGITGYFNNRHMLFMCSVDCVGRKLFANAQALI